MLERRNWAVLDDPSLYQPAPAAPVAGVDAGGAGERLWVRVERQTLRRLPETGAVVFGIRTRQRRLDALGAGDRHNLVAALRSIPPDAAAYKGLTTLGPIVVEWRAAHIV